MSRSYNPPQLPKFSFEHGIPIDRLDRQIDPITFKRYYTRTDEIMPLGFCVKGEPYNLWGLIP